MRVDRDLIERLEGSAALVEQRIVESFRRNPDDPARAKPFGSGALIAQGRGRFVNRAIGISLDDGIADRVDEVDAFFTAVDAPAGVEVSAWAPGPLAGALLERGYQPDWFGEMFVAPVSSLATGAADDAVKIDAVDTDLLPTWQGVFAAAFGYDTDTAQTVSDRHTEAVFGTAGTRHFLAQIDGEPAGCGSLLVDGDVAWVGGAATLPRFRGGGIQRALLAHRAAAAATSRCELLGATAVPAGASARNLRRAGFTPAHTRLIMSRASSAR